jgi:prenylcysteine oxidase / farnesylcysteine lyase
MFPPVAIPQITYMNVHVTILVTHSKISSAYFNVTGQAPQVLILTTLPDDPSEAPIFTVIEQVRVLPDGSNAYKIFSFSDLSDQTLQQIFDTAPILWTTRKTWQAYPRLDPISVFAPIELYPGVSGAGVWYTSGIESLASAMEVSALSGSNVAALIAQKLQWGGS